MALTNESFVLTDQVAHDHGVKIVVYAEPGMGKTMLVPTLPRPILISAESGLLSLKKKNIERVHGVGTPGITYNIPTILIKTLDDLDQALAYCRGPNGAGFDSIALDSISEISDICLATQKLLFKDGRQIYGEMLEVMDSKFKEFRDISGKNVYMSAKLEQSKDEMSGAMKYMPSMPGAKLGPRIPYIFDEVFVLRIGIDQAQKKYRYLQTQPDLQYTAKDRSGALATIEYPHLGAIIQKIKE
jgi:hypothetical protein